MKIVACPECLKLNIIAQSICYVTFIQTEKIHCTRHGDVEAMTILAGIDVADPRLPAMKPDSGVKE